MTPIARRTLFAAAAAASVAAPAAAALPEGAITMVVPFPAGGPTDLLGRSLAEAIGAASGRQVQVQNRPGGGSVPGSAGVARAAPDGRTLLFTSAAVAIGPAIVPNMPFVARSAFAPITIAVRAPMVLVVATTRQERTVAEMVAASQVRALTFVSAGSATPTHLALELMAGATGARIDHVPMRGSSEAMRALSESQADGAIENLAAVLPLLREGALRPLAVTTGARSPLLPEVPTLAQAGVGGVDVANWFALFAPGATAEPVQAAIHAAVAEGVAKLAIADRFAADGMVIAPMPRDESRNFFVRELDLWSRVARERNIVQG
jgi:tripartite-type tricarboxylate transporter receptor subunit TctC